MAATPQKDDAPAISRQRDVLRRLAEALNISEDAFLDETGDKADLEQAFEMLGLWRALGNSADHCKLLAFARTLVGDRVDP